MINLNHLFPISKCEECLFLPIIGIGSVTRQHNEMQYCRVVVVLSQITFFCMLPILKLAVMV